MVGLVEITAAINGLKGAMDIAKGLNAVADAVALNDAKIGLQTAIIDAQGSLLAAQETHTADLRRIEMLEQEIVRLKDWSADKERYELVNIWKGTVAYSEKVGVQGRKPPHWLCANCFEQGQKSHLQWQGDMGQRPSTNATAATAALALI